TSPRPITIPVVVNGGDGNDTLNAAAGASTLNGGNGNDTLVGGAGSCTLSGDAGNDVLIRGAGKWSVDGGAGFDSYYVPQRAGAAAFVGGATLDDLRQSDTGTANATLAAIGALV